MKKRNEVEPSSLHLDALEKHAYDFLSEVIKKSELKREDEERTYRVESTVELRIVEFIDAESEEDARDSSRAYEDVRDALCGHIDSDNYEISSDVIDCALRISEPSARDLPIEEEVKKFALLMCAYAKSESV